MDDAAAILGALKPGLECRLSFGAYSPWLRLIVSGFFDLKAAGLIALNVSTGRAPWGRESFAEAVIGPGVRIIYDAYDGYNFFYGMENPYEEFDRMLDSCDLWSKYNCDGAVEAKLRNRGKIRPFGFGSIFSGSRNNPFDNGWRPFNWRQLAKNAMGASDFVASHVALNSRHMWPEEYERGPSAGDGRAIYVARLWNPDAPEVENETVRRERVELNEFRVELVKCARGLLGKKFIGGIQRDAYSEKTSPGCIFDGPEAINRWPYLKTMRNVSVGITTGGLHGATSGKMGEYVAASRAIVSTPLRTSPPGDFLPGVNYLPAASPQEIVRQCGKLLDDPGFAMKMGVANHLYYSAYAKPANLIAGTLVRAMESGKGKK